MIHHVVHHSRSALKRGFFSLFIVSVVMGVGTVGVHRTEGVSWLRSFYFMSMIATGQGTNFVPATDEGLVFLSFMSFVSVGTVVAALGFLFGPFFGMLFNIGVEKLEEMRSMKKK